MLKIVVLISGGGSNLKALLQACHDDTYPARVVAVGSDTDAPGLAHAHTDGVPTFIVEPRNYPDRAAWGDAFLDAVQEHEPDLVVSAGLMRILPERFVETLNPRLINTHPALLPLYPGAHAVRDALAAGATETGVTVHVIDAGVDTGPVIRQASLSVRPGEGEDQLHERIKELERPLLVETVREIALGTIQLTDYLPSAPAKE